MRIGINCRSFLNKDFTGIGRYTSQLLQSLSEIDSQNQYLLYAPKRFFAARRRLPKVPAQNFHLKIDRFYRGIDKTVGAMDVYHCPSPEALGPLNGAKIVVTIHDLIFKTFPQGHTSETVDETERQIHLIVERASKIICCSRSTLHDLNRFFKVDPKKTALIYQGVDSKDFYLLDAKEQFQAQDTVRREGIDGPFILFVGTIEPRKNLRNLLAAFSILKKKKKFLGKLVVIGRQGWLDQNLLELSKELGVHDEVCFTGFLSNQELRHFYHQAQVFVFPSHYEGFGFPIVEAFSCGTPVVTSNVSSCPEIAGGAALTVDPQSPVKIADAVCRILEDPDLRRELREKGINRAREFSFAKTARETLKVYEEVCTRVRG